MTEEQLKVGRRGTVSFTGTVDELVAAAINVTQNGWPLEALGHHWMKSNVATQRMLEQIYEQILEANRLVVEKRRGRQKNDSRAPHPEELPPA